MVNIFYGRESIDKEKFIYESIDEKKEQAIVIVPDQYTLQAERQAVKYLKSQGLMDVEIVSMSRLGHRIIKEVGGGQTTFIDKYGRHMLLSKIARKEKDKLKAFRGYESRSSFIDMVNEFITDMKQYNGTSEALSQLSQAIDGESYLKNKLEDIYYLYKIYEEETAGKFTDSEDYLALFVEAIEKSEFFKDRSVWIYGFDSFTPRSMDILAGLMKKVASLNIVLTFDEKSFGEDLFQLGKIVINNISELATSLGISVSSYSIGKGFSVSNKANCVANLEKNLFSLRPSPMGDVECFQGLTVLEAANPYNEAESAASYIMELVRDNGYRYRDIVLVCNDQEVRASIIERVFTEYGIDIFLDKKRSIINSPIVIYIMTLMEVVMKGFRTQDLFRGLKTGFSNCTVEEVELLENYSYQFGIKGNMWKKPFMRGQAIIGEEALATAEAIRIKAVTPYMNLEQRLKDVKTVEDFVKVYYNFLVEDCGIEEKIIAYSKEQEARGKLDLSSETTQIFGEVVKIFDQLVVLMGEEAYDKKIISDILVMGFNKVEVGVLPPTTDGILMGTMQRTRTGSIKALVVVGANEGLLPQDPATDTLFSLEEKNFFIENGKEICKVDSIRSMEEQLGIYRNMSKPSEKLYISYSLADQEGKAIRPSEIISKIRRIFTNLSPLADVVNRGKPIDLIVGKANTLRHLTDVMAKDEVADEEWRAAYLWYEKNRSDKLRGIEKGLDFKNVVQPIPPELAQGLFKRDLEKPLSLSPSRLERYSRCPFSHLISYGLKPEERREFKVSGREIGDLYHLCIMEISKALTLDGVEITHGTSPWMTITEDECERMVDEIVEREIPNYREGLFLAGNGEKYKADRIKEICKDVCWVLIGQVRAGKIVSSDFEVGFGRQRSIKPIVLDVLGEKVYIEGKIDRVDILPNDKVKIIDYKTGKEHFDTDEARGGYKLQLMLYLKAAQESSRKPAGVFYCNISEAIIDISNKSRELAIAGLKKDISRSFKLDGTVIDEIDVINHIAGAFDGFSDILPLRATKEGIKGTGKDNLMNVESFTKLQTDIDKEIKSLCEDLLSGIIKLEPKKTKDSSPCTYCEYKGICRFDTVFEGCKYKLI